MKSDFFEVVVRRGWGIHYEKLDLVSGVRDRPGLTYTE